MLMIELTEEQKEQLAPLFEAVRNGNRAGVKSAIGAQIWMDGMVVKLFDGDQGSALSSALGGDWSNEHCSAEDRMTPNST